MSGRRNQVGKLIQDAESAAGRGDHDIAFKIYSTLASEGDLTGQRMVAWSYLTGVGTTKDVTEASDRFADAANKGDIWSMWYLGRNAFVEKNYPLAVLWYEKAADKDFASYSRILVMGDEGGVSWR